jgi:hypothetical protein
MDTRFGKKMSDFLKGTDKNCLECKEGMAKLLEKYAEVNDKLMLAKADEMRSKSDKFFVFFTEYFNQVIKCMPKPEEPKKNKKGPAGRAAKTAD